MKSFHLRFRLEKTASLTADEKTRKVSATYCYIDLNQMSCANHVPQGNWIMQAMRSCKETEQSNKFEQSVFSAQKCQKHLTCPHCLSAMQAPLHDAFWTPLTKHISLGIYLLKKPMLQVALHVNSPSLHFPISLFLVVTLVRFFCVGLCTGHVT